MSTKSNDSQAEARSAGSGFVPAGPSVAGSPRRIRAALFVDFDNVFGGLFKADRDTAVAFGEKPELWLKRLETYGLSGTRRDLLVRR
ncbi:MAG TPA: hypothetical protein VL068_10750, partial [Microthrixaceae bacterium]|nr:hypothetical protein [Microthrixaceae bacterium]